jgi:hypothetical protein
MNYLICRPMASSWPAVVCVCTLEYEVVYAERNLQALPRSELTQDLPMSPTMDAIFCIVPTARVCGGGNGFTARESFVSYLEGHRGLPRPSKYVQTKLVQVSIADGDFLTDACARGRRFECSVRTLISLKKACVVRYVCFFRAPWHAPR